MKQNLFYALIVASITAACGKSDETVAPAPAPVANSVDISKAAPSPAPTTPAPTAPPPAANAVAAPTGPDIDAGAEKRMPNGMVAQDNLEYLNGLVAHLNEGRATYSTDAMPTFKTPEEKQAYDAALKKMKEPITDIEELVKARLIKKIPAAPAGKKYVINPTTHKVELANL